MTRNSLLLTTSNTIPVTGLWITIRPSEAATGQSGKKFKKLKKTQKFKNE